MLSSFTAVNGMTIFSITETLTGRVCEESVKGGCTEVSNVLMDEK